MQIVKGKGCYPVAYSSNLIVKQTILSCGPLTIPLCFFLYYHLPIQLHDKLTEKARRCLGIASLEGKLTAFFDTFKKIRDRQISYRSVFSP